MWLIISIILASLILGFFYIWYFFDGKKEQKHYSKLTKLKLLSDSVTDIEHFYSKNLDNLDENSLNSLLLRIEELKANNVILNDSIKTRVCEECLSNLDLDSIDESPTKPDISVKKSTKSKLKVNKNVQR